MTSNVVHNTLAANRLDPNIQADGHLNAGAGVGGASEQTIQKEGIEHIKSQTFGSSESSSSQSQTPSQTQSQSDVHQEGIDHIKRNTFGSAQPAAAASHPTTSNALGSQLEPPASNPGSDDATGGIGSGSGGVSSTTNIDSRGTNSSTTTTTTQPTTSVIGSTVEEIKSYLGFGSSSTTTTESSQKEAQDAAAPGYGTASGVTRPDTDGPVNDYHPSSAAVIAIINTNNAATSLPHTATTTTTTTMSDSTEPSQADKRIQDKTADDVPTTEAKDIPASDRGLEDAETTTGADKQTEDTTDADQAGAGPGDKGESDKPPAAAGGQTGAVENKSAIPTAGGERLGEKHWGESKMVPDNPKPQEETDGAGVSSADGQPTDQVKHNTAANTGSATGGPNSHGEKESVVDKLKDKMHMGHKKE